MAKLFDVKILVLGLCIIICQTEVKGLKKLGFQQSRYLNPRDHFMFPEGEGSVLNSNPFIRRFGRAGPVVRPHLFGARRSSILQGLRKPESRSFIADVIKRMASSVRGSSDTSPGLYDDDAVDAKIIKDEPDLSELPPKPSFDQLKTFLKKASKEEKDIDLAKVPGIKIVSKEEFANILKKNKKQQLQDDLEDDHQIEDDSKPNDDTLNKVLSVLDNVNKMIGHNSKLFDNKVDSKTAQAFLSNAKLILEKGRNKLASKRSEQLLEDSSIVDKIHSTLSKHGLKNTDLLREILHKPEQINDLTGNGRKDKTHLNDEFDDVIEEVINYDSDDDDDLDDLELPNLDDDTLTQDDALEDDPSPQPSAILDFLKKLTNKKHAVPVARRIQYVRDEHDSLSDDDNDNDSGCGK